MRADIDKLARVAFAGGRGLTAPKDADMASIRVGTRLDWHSAVRGVLRTIREPSDDMLAAGMAAYMAADGYNERPTEHELAAAFSAMIDGILTGPVGGKAVDAV